VTRPERDDSDAWFEAEQPMRSALVEELQRLKRRARARLPLVILIATALTGAFMYKRMKKVKGHQAKVVLAVTEGTLSQRHQPMPLHEMKEYIVNVLMNDTEIVKIMEKHDLMPGPSEQLEVAVEEFLAALEIEVVRNYFLLDYSEDAPRSARIAIRYEDADSELSWEIVHDVAALIIEGQRRRTLEMAAEMSQHAQLALDNVRAEAVALEQAVAEAGVAAARAEQLGDPELPALRFRYGQLSARLNRQQIQIARLADQADADQTAAAIVRAGLAMSFEITQEVRSHDDGPPPLYFQIILAGVVFFMALPTVAIFVGAFDTRVHDREDVERIGLPVLGHLPPFPGDHVGSLRARGVRRPRVPS
jgi:hypothetical protein